ncbi:hypothetical protein MD484_g5566, partial [Candolleomyces efflorescens]
MASLLRSYNSALLRRPMLVQCITAAVMFGAGDVIAQQAVEGKGMKHDIYLDQAVLTPAGVLFFYASMSTLEGKWEKAYERIEEAYVPTLVRNWLVFIPTQIVNFSVVPPHLRMVTVGVVSLFWNTYLSVANAPLAAAAAAAEEAKALAAAQALAATQPSVDGVAGSGDGEKGSAVVV